MTPRHLAIVALLAMASVPTAAADPLNLGSRRELFLDHFLIDRLEGVGLQVHRPKEADVAIRKDRSWESAYAFNFGTVFQDGDRYRMYFNSMPRLQDEGSAVDICGYAESKDGMRWTKPDLGIYEVHGTKRNNAVLTNLPPFACNLSPFIDTKPGTPLAQRYKALAGLGDSGLAAFVSPDGLHWKKMQDQAVITESGWVFDSQNVAFWSESERCYLCYYRRCPERVRAIARRTSPDFLRWSEPVQMRYGEGGTKPAEELYINQTLPYYRAPHIYVAMAARFMANRRALSTAQFAQLAADKAAPWLANDCSDAVLLTSRGGDRYDRTFKEAFIQPGPGAANWVSRSNYPYRGVVPTGPAEMSAFAQRHNGQASVHVARYVLRIDGFASVHAPYGGGEMITKALSFQGKELEINFATSAAGSIRVELQEAAGSPIPGYTLADCPQIFGDQVERVVAWKGGSDVGRLAGRPIRLRFVMKDADLYSLRFR